MLKIEVTKEAVELLTRLEAVANRLEALAPVTGEAPKPAKVKKAKPAVEVEEAEELEADEIQADDIELDDVSEDEDFNDSEEFEEEEEKPAPKKTKAAPAPAATAPTVTKGELIKALQAASNKKGRTKVMAIMEKVTGAKRLEAVEPSKFGALMKAINA